MIYLDAGATTLQKPPMVAYHMQSALRRMATPCLLYTSDAADE